MLQIQGSFRLIIAWQRILYGSFQLGYFKLVIFQVDEDHGYSWLGLVSSVTFLFTLTGSHVLDWIKKFWLQRHQEPFKKLMTIKKSVWIRQHHWQFKSKGIHASMFYSHLTLNKYALYNVPNRKTIFANNLSLQWDNKGKYPWS